MFGLIVVGSIVRTTGSGLACPDWPLCEGRLIPRLDPHVLIEWLHRLLALLVSLLLAATALWVLGHRETRARLGGLVALALGLLVVQVLLGALTVWKLLSPAVVSSHLAVALLLFSTLLVIALAAGDEAEAGPERLQHQRTPRPPGLLPLFALTTLLLYGQAVLGGVVSTSGASLACPDWPTCRGEWLPPLDGLVGIQMAHRIGAYLLIAMLAVLIVRARNAADPLVARVGGALLGLAVGQMAIGVVNIVVGIHAWLSALHLANAAGMLALCVAATYHVAASPAPARAAVLEATS